MFSFSKIINKLFKDDQPYIYNEPNDPFNISINELILEMEDAREKEKAKIKEKEINDLVERIADRVVVRFKEIEKEKPISQSET